MNVIIPNSCLLTVLIHHLPVAFCLPLRERLQALSLSWCHRLIKSRWCKWTMESVLLFFLPSTLPAPFTPRVGSPLLLRQAFFRNTAPLWGGRGQLLLSLPHLRAPRCLSLRGEGTARESGPCAPLISRPGKAPVLPNQGGLEEGRGRTVRHCRPKTQNLGLPGEHQGHSAPRS